MTLQIKKRWNGLAMNSFINNIISKDDNFEYGKPLNKDEEKKFIDLFNESKKKDDLADCFLQGLWYIKHVIQNN